MLKIPKKVDKNLARLYIKHQFYAHPGSQLKLRITEDCIDPAGNPTWATDGHHLFIHPEALKNDTDDECVWTFAHEITHPLSRHSERRGDRDAWKWNLAADFEINLPLRDAKVGAEPKNILCDEQYREMSAEKIYNLLEKEQEKDPKGFEMKFGTPTAPKFRMGQVLKPAEGIPQEQKVDWQAVAVTAATIVKKLYADPGDIPAYMHAFLEAIEKPRPSARALFEEFIDSRVVVEESWRNPDRRFLYKDMYLPGKVSSGMEKLGVVVDCSGSMTDRILAEYAGWIEPFINGGTVQEVEVFYIDTRIQHVDVFECGDDFKLERHGRGGTDLSAAFDAIAEKDDCSAVVCFSDMQNNGWGTEPSAPVMFVDFEPNDGRQWKRTPPFGTVVEDFNNA